MKIKAFFVLVLILTFFIGCSSDTKSLKVLPSKADFEDVYLGDSKDIALTLTNKYGKDITITNLILEGSNDFSISNSIVTPIDILKGGEYNLTITFTPITGGTVEGLLKIRHTGATKDKEISLMGNGVPVARITLSESSYDYQMKIISKSHTHNFEIENVGTAALDISDMTFSGVGASAYSITSGAAPVNILASQKHTFTVTFAPVAVGTYSADLAITHNAINESVPFIIHFDGEGVLIDPRITLSVGSTWDFGSVATTLPPTLVCEIENTGIDPLDVTSATLTTNAEFQIDSVEDSNGNALNFPLQVAVGAKIFLAVKFTPTANQNYNDKLSIVHNGTNENSPLEISLTGAGRNEMTKSFSYTGVIEDWVIPGNVSFVRIEAWGAQGGGTGYGTPGKGARMRGDFFVTPNDTLKIAVGEIGETGGQGGGGGGGSFVVCNNQPLIIAGGGGGSHYNNQGLDGKDGVITQTCTPHPPTGTGYTGGSGGGWTGDGANGDYGCTGGSSWANGLTGGLKNTRLSGHWSNGDGGFGGGGGGCWAPGSAGGYNGGVSATSYGNQTPGGTGGGSINNGINQSNTAGVQIGHGKIVITY